MDNGRADRVGRGSAMEHGLTASRQLGSGVEGVDGSRGCVQLGSCSAPAPDARAGFRAAGRQAGQGDGSAPYLNKVSIDEDRRRGNGNADNEDDVPMRNDSTTRETTWKGRVATKSRVAVFVVKPAGVSRRAVLCNSPE